MVGRDVRASSETLTDALIEGLTEAGADVLDLGLCGTEEMYFATTHFGADGGIEVTASHNPIDYNGMKIVRARLAPRSTPPPAFPRSASWPRPARPRREPAGGAPAAEGARDAYVERVLSFVEVAALPAAARSSSNAGNGAAGPDLRRDRRRAAAAGAPLEFVRMHHEPDGSFPNGIPNPLLPENQPVTAEAVVAAAGADFGRRLGRRLRPLLLLRRDRAASSPGEYVVGLLAEAFLAREPGRDHRP